MLNLENRLKKMRDFNLLMKHGHWLNGHFLNIKVLELAKTSDYFPPKINPKDFKNQLRLAIVVGLKVSKSAVKRNRSRRQMQEVIRLMLKENLIRNGYYVLLAAKKDILEKNYTEISQEIELLFRRAKLMK